MEQGHVDYGVYEDQHGRQRNIQEPIYEPFDSKEELQVANWIIQENITRSAIDRLAKIGIYNKDGKQIVFASKNRTKKVEQIREIYPELGKDKYETIAFEFTFGPRACRWNKSYEIVFKDPIGILRSLIDCDTSFNDEQVKIRRRDPLDDIRKGSVYQDTQREIYNLNPNGKLIGIILSIDDANLTRNSGAHNGRPLYMTTANQSLESRRQRKTNAWRIVGLLPVIQISQEVMSPTEKKYIAHAKVEFTNRVLERVLQSIQAVYDTGFANATGDAQYYPRLICCLSDMKEAWSLWGLRHMTCPVCVVSKKDLNRTDTTYNTRPDFMLTTAIRDYERMDERAQFDFAADIRRVNGHFPVRLAFSGICHDAFNAYIGDILHQPKKGIFVNLLSCLQGKLRAERKLEMFKTRVIRIPTYTKIEHFGRSWFDVSKMTASNYRDMSRQIVSMPFDMDIGPLFFHFSEFLYYCHYVSHDRNTLQYMRTSLTKFKEEVQRHFYENHKTEFSTPKYHILEHYVGFIERFGSLLNGDTDTTEGLHPTVKSAYRNTNKKGNYVAQMARNLDEATIISMYYNMKIIDEEPIEKRHHQLSGKTSGGLRINDHREQITQYLQQRFDGQYEPQELEGCKIILYNGVHCIYRNTNDPEKDLRLIARAVPVWKYGADKEASRYDFVLLNNRPHEEGLAGVDIARLYLLCEAKLPDNVVLSLAVVRMCDRVLDETLLPTYRYNDEVSVIPVSLIVRNVHMVPRWDRPVQGGREQPSFWNDIYDEYEQFLFNTHTDCAAWTYYYD